MSISTAATSRSRIEGKELIKIISTETGGLYIDEALNGYIFEDKEKAAKFVSENRGTAELAAALYSYSNLLWECTALGIGHLVIDGDLETAIPTKKNKRERKYCNPKLTSTVYRLLETNELRYLEELGAHHFIIPISIKSVTTSTGSKQLIDYGVIKPGTGKNVKEEDKVCQLFYLAFTDLDQFNEWVGMKGRDFCPIEAEYWQLKQVIGESGLCINPGQPSALFLTPDLIAMINYKEPETITV